MTCIQIPNDDDDDDDNGDDNDDDDGDDDDDDDNDDNDNDDMMKYKENTMNIIQNVYKKPASVTIFY